MFSYPVFELLLGLDSVVLAAGIEKCFAEISRGDLQISKV
jgi:hypothetical protein